MTTQPISLDKDEYELLDVLKVAAEPWDMSTFPSGLRQGLMRRGLIDRTENGKYFITPRGDTAHGQYVTAPDTGDPMKKVIQKALDKKSATPQPPTGSNGHRAGKPDVSRIAAPIEEAHRIVDAVIASVSASKLPDDPPAEQRGEVQLPEAEPPAAPEAATPEAPPVDDPCRDAAQSCGPQCLNRRALETIFARYPQMRGVLTGLEAIDQALEK